MQIYEHLHIFVSLWNSKMLQSQSVAPKKKIINVFQNVKMYTLNCIRIFIYCLLPETIKQHVNILW